MESPETASEMACPMVLQGVVGDKQLLLLFPLTPFTYHVVADAIGTHRANSNVVVILYFMIVSSLSRRIQEAPSFVKDVRADWFLFVRVEQPRRAKGGRHASAPTCRNP